MAFVRFGEQGSDVYVYESTEGGFECCRCDLVGGSFVAADQAGMVAHLLAHRAAGGTVPQLALDALRAEIEQAAASAEADGSLPSPRETSGEGPGEGRAAIGAISPP